MLLSAPGIEMRIASGSGFDCFGSGSGLRRIGSESARRRLLDGRVGQERRIKFAAQTRWKTLETWLGEGEGEAQGDEGKEDESSVVQRWWMSLKEAVGEKVL